MKTKKCTHKRMYPMGVDEEKRIGDVDKQYVYLACPDCPEYFYREVWGISNGGKGYL